MVYLPDNCFKNILDFCGRAYIAEMDGKPDNKEYFDWLKNTEAGKKWDELPGETKSVMGWVCEGQPFITPGKVYVPSNRYNEYLRIKKGVKYQDAPYINRLTIPAEKELILKWYYNENGELENEYVFHRSYGKCCKDCGKFKPNTYVRCIDCYAINQKIWEEKMAYKIPKGKCLIKI